ncbi:MAG: porin [Proteobacteria bacterium]|uniref:Porin n=1 Tax=Candidatus Avisuccinivibrio stercorigallinarum TaxID=2840704 RepID=A0A9D9GSC9_9GAMM|nr:porin [Candidatus Avisuccinivibrio stercorigallinarum]
MKQTLIALAVAAVAASTVGAAQAATVFDKDGTSLDVYGRIQAVVYSADTGNTNAQGDYGDNSLDASARLGLNMRNTINQYMSAFAKAEWEAANGDDGEGGDDDFNARYLWVGLDFNQFGSIKFGKFEDAIKYTIVQTDIFEDFGCVAQLGNDDRRAGQAMYEWSGWGIDFKLSGQTANNNQQVDGAYFTKDGNENLDINAGFAASLGYTTPDVLFGPIAIRVGYSYAEFQDSSDEGEQNSAINYAYDDYNQYAASIAWGGETGFYTAVMYSNRDFSMDSSRPNDDYTGGNFLAEDYKVQGVEFVLRYGFMNGISIMAGWEWQNFDQDGAEGQDLDAYTLNAEIDWQVTPNFKVWTEARWDLDSDDGYDDATNGVTNYEEDVYSIGARYTF